MDLVMAHAAELASTVIEHEKKVGILEASYSNERDDLEKRIMSAGKELSQVSSCVSVRHYKDFLLDIFNNFDHLVRNYSSILPMQMKATL